MMLEEKTADCRVGFVNGRLKVEKDVNFGLKGG